MQLALVVEELARLAMDSCRLRTERPVLASSPSHDLHLTIQLL